MNYILTFWTMFLVLVFFVVYCDVRFFILRDTTRAYKPYSWSRVQLAWWTVIILSSFITIMLQGNGIPTFNESTLVLLGISAATTATARVIDLSEKTVSVPDDGTPKKSHFLLDILSDEYNINMHRFQTVIFNVVFGVYFINHVLRHFNTSTLETMNAIMPAFETNNLILLGLSSATYAALKTTENKTKEKEKETEKKETEVVLDEEPAVG